MATCPSMNNGMDLDLEDDLDDLRGLRTESPQVPADLEGELDSAWRDLHGIPEFGYSVTKGFGLDSMELWKVRFVAKAGVPGWGHHNRRVKCWVNYEFVECIWKGPSAKVSKTVTMKDGRVISQFRGGLETFELSLIDAVCKLGQYRDEHRREALGHLVSLRESLRSIEAEIEKRVVYLRRLDEFHANEVVPSDLLEAEEMEIDRVLSELRDT